MARKKRRKKITSEKKLAATEKKIDEIFEKKKNKKISVKSMKSEKHKGKGNSFKTYQKYSSQVKTLIKELGINDLKDLNQERIDTYVSSEIKKFKDGDVDAASRINVRLSALKSLQQGIIETNVIGENAKKEINFGNIQDYRDLVKENNVFRTKKGSSWKFPTNREMRTVKDRLKRKYEESQDPIDKIAYKYVRYAQITGSRPNNGLSVKDEHIKINKDGTATVIHWKDKGSLTRKITVYDKKNVEFLKELKAESDRGKIFQAYKSDKTPMSNDSLQKRVRERLKDVTHDMYNVKEVKVKNNETKFKKEQRITLHSIRKNYSTNRSIELYDYFMRNPRETNKRMKEVLQEMGSREPKVLKKYSDLIDKHNRRNKYKKIDMLSPEETALYLTSCELGHFRTDVIKDSYLDQKLWNEIRNKYKNR